MAAQLTGDPHHRRVPAEGQVDAGANRIRAAPDGSTKCRTHDCDEGRRSSEIHGAPHVAVQSACPYVRKSTTSCSGRVQLHDR